jgi:hypothetical protein
VDISIWDGRIDKEGCDLERESRLIYPTLSQEPLGAAVEPRRDPDCKNLRPPDVKWEDRFDHGTLVAGILAAQVNGKGTAGVNPNVRIWGWEVLNGDDFNQSGDPSRLMRKDYRDLQIKVINISQTYPLAAKSLLETALFGDGGQGLRRGYKDALIVAAAGERKDGTQIGGLEIDKAVGCSFFPACWSATTEGDPHGIISVVALDKSGTSLLRGSDNRPLTNYGQAFDVSAVGETVTTLHGNWFAIVKGSSVAAPYVTGLASLLYAKAAMLHVDPAPSVQTIKQRILFTAQPDLSLAGTSRFGRIDFGRAIDFENSVIEFHSGPACPRPCIKPVRIDADADDGIVVLKGLKNGITPLANKVFISFAALGRLIAQDGTSRFAVYYIDSDGRPAKIENAELGEVTKNNIVKSNAEPAQFRPADILDFTACSIQCKEAP